jgi:hypothetical protein
MTLQSKQYVTVKNITSIRLENNLKKCALAIMDFFCRRQIRMTIAASSSYIGLL